MWFSSSAGRQDLGLVDVVHVERLEDLGLGEVADAGLGHDRDRDAGLDLLDHLGVAHARDAAVAADVRGHALERHDRHGAGVLGDLGLLGVDDVHDHPAAQHVGQAALDERRTHGGMWSTHGPILPGRAHHSSRARARNVDVVEVAQVRLGAVAVHVEPDPALRRRRRREVKYEPAGRSLAGAALQRAGEAQRVADGGRGDLVGAVGHAHAGQRAARLVRRATRRRPGSRATAARGAGARGSARRRPRARSVRSRASARRSRRTDLVRSSGTSAAL